MTPTRDCNGSFVHFFVPPDAMPEDPLPTAPGHYWEWMCAARRQRRWRYDPLFVDWILQTYVHLRADGFPCDLVHAVPTNGILVYNREAAPVGYRPRPDLLGVCVLGDEERRDPSANLHIVQNPNDSAWERRGPFSGHYYIPGWTQPGLVPRNPARGERFENVGYLGYERNLARALRDPSWRLRLSESGLQWQVRTSERFHDYSDLDAIVAVRTFDDERYISKPASKLYNAWRAGVPAVLGRESAYRAQRRGELDYLEVGSPEEALAALARLRDDIAFRRAVIANGRLRSREVEDSQIVARWRQFLSDVATPAYGRWSSASPAARWMFLAGRRVARGGRSARRVAYRHAARAAMTVLPDVVLQTLKRVRSRAPDGR